MSLRASTIGFVAVIALVTGCGGRERTSTSRSSASLSVGPRIWLSSGVLAALRQRAASGDAAWSTLRGHCDALATGTVEPPSGNAYPDYPNIGQGYQGDGYLPEILSLGLCFQTATGTDDASASRWAQAGARVLGAMATPVGAGGQPPQTDDGYGIRNYGVGLALGYDWLRPALDDATRASVASALDTWIGWYDAKGFSKDEPIGNYFAGYLFAKGAAAIALEGDDANASSWWSDVETRMWPNLVKPAYGSWLAGGGWPEGWQYGPRAVQNVVGFLWAASTGKSLSWWNDVPLAHAEAGYIAAFTWPSRKHIDDRGTVHAQSVLAPSASTMGMLATVLDQQGDAFATAAHGVAADLLSATGESVDAWQSFLFWDPAMKPQASTCVASLATSYIAPGPGHVAMRSSWASDATWASFASGAYINAPDSGEQYFDEGGLAIAHGDSPVLVNATGWLPQVAGDSGEQLVYDDTWGSRTRLLDNTFYVAGGTQTGPDPTQSATHIERFEDHGAWVRARGAQINQMYTSQAAVTQFSRDLAYLRPGTFVVYDRTTVGGGGMDQWIAWHVAGTPAQSTSSDGTPRFDVSTGSTLRALLPLGSAVKTVGVAGGAVSRIELHASAPAQDWLTVVTVGTSPDVERVTPTDGNVTSGALVGAHVRGSPRESVVLFASEHAGGVQCAGGDYALAQATDADHIVFDVAASATGYAVTAALRADGKLAVHVAPGGSLSPTPQGTLAFTVSASGAVTPM
jgi:hypothetical protein